MTTDPIASAPPAASPQPSAEQLARKRRRRRFYRLRAVLPVTLVALLWLGVTLLLLWLAVVGKWFAVDTDQAYYRTLLSGIADIVLILSLLPLLLLCALPSGLAVGLAFYRRSKKRAAPDQPEKLPFFWRVENIVIRVNGRLEEVLPKVARPVASAYALVAFVRAFMRELREIITREINRYGR